MSAPAVSRIALNAVVAAAVLTGCGTAAAPIPPETAPVTVAPALSGRPGPGTTGVPAGMTLQPSGPLRITARGAVVDGLDVTGSIIIEADDVTIRNTRVTASGRDIRRVITSSKGAQDITIENVEVDGAGVADIGVDVSRSRLVRLNVHGSNDGVRLGSHIELRDSWVHDLVRKDDLHPDTVQGISAQDVLITGNVLDPRSSDGADLGNSAIMLGSESGPRLSRNVVIRDNELDGGNYALNISGDITAEDFVIEGNTFGDGSRYGAVVAPRAISIGTDNVLAATGEAVTPDSPKH